MHHADEQGDALPTKNLYFSIYHVLSSIPDPLNIVRTSIYSLSAHFPIPIYCHLRPKNRTMLTRHSTYPWYLGLLHHRHLTSPSSFIFSIDTTLYFIKNSSVFNLQNENLCPVTSISLFGWPLPDLEYSSCRPFTAIILTLTSSPPSPCAKNQQSLFGNAKTQHPVDIVSVVSSTTHPCPLHTLSTLVDLLNFSTVPACGSVF